MKKSILITLFFMGCTVSLFGQGPGGMGFIMDSTAYSNTPLIDKPLGFGKDLPRSMSLQQYCPSIGNQGQTGTCTAWSSTYYVATMEFAILNNITDRESIDALSFDPYYTYLNLLNEEQEAKKSCEDGTYLGYACDFLMDNGVKRLALESYDCSSKESAKYSKEKVSIIDFTNYTRMFKPTWEEGEADSFDDVITTVCQTIVNKHPVMLGMTLLESFFKVGADGLYSASTGSQKEVGGHAMCVVGYDDDKFGGSFLVANSWGDKWGAGGYVYITYEDFYKYTFCAFAVESEMKGISTAGCIAGDCNSDFGLMKFETKKMNGVFEGKFVDGEAASGIYTNLTGDISEKEIKEINSIVSKNYGSDYIYSNGKIVGYIRPY